MSANPLQIELDQQAGLSVAPWIVALACAAVLIVLMAQLVQRIPASLLQQAQPIVSNANLADARVSVSGRNLHLTGSIDIGQSPAALINELSLINGVNEVVDSLITIDPAQVAEQAALDFQQSLRSIDTTVVAFKPGSILFTDASRPVLEQILDLLIQHPDSRIRIEGHTDNTGTTTVNLRVSRDRAAAVANYFLNNGVVGNRLIVKGYGDTQPIAENTTEPGRARNRRIEISYVY